MRAAKCCANDFSAGFGCFEGRTATRTLQPRVRKEHPRIGLQNGEIPHPSLGDIVNLHDHHTAPTTPFRMRWERPELGDDLGTGCVGLTRAHAQSPTHHPARSLSSPPWSLPRPCRLRDGPLPRHHIAH